MSFRATAYGGARFGPALGLGIDSDINSVLGDCENPDTLKTTTLAASCTAVLTSLVIT